jgi:hypothetical protein
LLGTSDARRRDEMSGPTEDPDPTTVSAKPSSPERVEGRGLWSRTLARWRSLAAWRDLKDLSAQLLTFLVILLAVSIDLLFVAAWALLHQLFEELVMHRLKLEGLDRFSLALFRWVFNGLTLYAVMLYVVKDAVRIFHRVWDK